MLISLNNINSFHIITLNFIINLLSAKNSYINKTYDVILMLINKLIKYVTYITITKNLKIDKFVKIDIKINYISVLNKITK